MCCTYVSEYVKNVYLKMFFLTSMYNFLSGEFFGVASDSQLNLQSPSSYL